MFRARIDHAPSHDQPAPAAAGTHNSDMSHATSRLRSILHPRSQLLPLQVLTTQNSCPMQIATVDLAPSQSAAAAATSGAHNSDSCHIRTVSFRPYCLVLPVPSRTAGTYNSEMVPSAAASDGRGGSVDSAREQKSEAQHQTGNEQETSDVRQTVNRCAETHRLWCCAPDKRKR